MLVEVKHLASLTKFLTHVQVLNRELALILRLFSSVCKQQDIVAAMRTEAISYVPRYMFILRIVIIALLNGSSCFPLQREQAVQCMDSFLRALTSIPGIDSHDANAVSCSAVCMIP